MTEIAIPRESVVGTENESETVATVVPIEIENGLVVTDQNPQPAEMILLVHRLAGSNLTQVTTKIETATGRQPQLHQSPSPRKTPTLLKGRLAIASECCASNKTAKGPSLLSPSQVTAAMVVKTVWWAGAALTTNTRTSFNPSLLFVDMNISHLRHHKSFMAQDGRPASSFFAGEFYFSIFFMSLFSPSRMDEMGLLVR